MDKIENNTQLVSIDCITYNHAPYIRQCLDGFLMQKTTFPIEVLIHDDASTDGTSDIIREYELKYPEIFKPIYQTENQYSKGIGISATYNFPRAKGKYIALCEGDDYWIDPLKLQKQVDFLEAHSEYSLTCGGYLYGDLKKEVVLEKGSISFDLNTYTKWYTKTLTVVFRFECLRDYFDNMNNYKYSRDIHLFYHLLKKGKGYYFTDIFGVYNVHQGGVCSMVLPKINAINSYNCYKELYENNRDEYCRRMYFKSVLSILFNKNSLWPCFALSREGIRISKGVKEIICVLLYNFPIRYLKCFLKLI